MAEEFDNPELFTGSPSDDSIVIKIYDEERFYQIKVRDEEGQQQQQQSFDVDRNDRIFPEEDPESIPSEVVNEKTGSSPTKRRRKSNLPVRLKDDFLKQGSLHPPRTTRGESESSGKCQQGPDAEDVTVKSEAPTGGFGSSGAKRRSDRLSNTARIVQQNSKKTRKKRHNPKVLKTQSVVGNEEEISVDQRTGGDSPHQDNSGSNSGIGNNSDAVCSEKSDAVELATANKVNVEESPLAEGTSFPIEPLESRLDQVYEDKDVLIQVSKTTKSRRNKKSTCKKCHKSFSSRSVLAVHQTSCHKKAVRVSKFECEWCYESFRTIRQRNTHNREEHTEKKAYPCRFCPRVFTESSHCKRHLRSHTGERPYSCEICGKEFVDNSYIRRHMLIHKGVKPFQCDQCGKTFREKTHLSRHEETHKREQETCSKCNKALYGDQNRCACKDRVKPLKMEEKKNFTCDKCGKGFTKEGNFQRHLREHEKGTLPQDNVFSCDVCSKEFGLERHLLRHKRIHTGEKPFQCTECGKQFRDSSYIRRHMRIHAGHKPFQCDRCDKTFRESGHLSRHMLTHTGEKKFNCSTCGKGYQDRVCLLRHESKCVISTIRPDEKVSQLCDICGKEYLGKGSLRRHRQIHSGQKSHYCTLCPAEFYDSSSLKRHLAIHSRDPATINQCSICKRVFRTRRALNIHYDTHNENASADKFECNICNLEFPSSESLALHAGAHTYQILPTDVEIVDEEDAAEPESQMVLQVVNNLECKLCHKLFATPQNLASHELTHAQSILGDTLTPAAITVSSASQEISTEVLLPSALLESSVPHNADDFEGLFKLLQVIAQANQNQSVTQTAGGVVEVPTIRVSGVDVSGSNTREPTIVTVVAADGSTSSIPSYIGQPMAVATGDLESSRPLEGDAADLNGIEDLEFNVSVPDLTPENDLSSDSDQDAPKLQCEFCIFECHRNKTLAIHMANIHPTIVFAKQLPIEREKQENRVLQWQCPFCNEVFEVEENMREHNCRGVKDKPFKCSRCDLSFPRKPALTQHLKIHENEPQYRCSFCQKTFHFKNSLTYHERIHTQEKPFKCTTCEKAFKDKSHLRRHEKIHEGVKPYSCQICAKSFLERSQLVKHIRVHSGEKPYLCAKCGKSFADASHLRRHSALHESVRERKHPCPDCNKAFRTNDGLRSHKKIHVKEKAFKCDICNKSFSDRTILKRHKRCHREEKPYTCQICEKPFRERCQLVKHFRIHTGDKPYPCKVCDKRFADTPQRKRHVMTAHAVPTHAAGEKLSELSFCHICGEAFTEKELLKSHCQSHEARTMTVTTF